MQDLLLRLSSSAVRGAPSLSTTCAVQSGQVGILNGSPASSVRMSLPPATAHRSTVAGSHR